MGAGFGDEGFGDAPVAELALGVVPVPDPGFGDGLGEALGDEGVADLVVVALGDEGVVDLGAGALPNKVLGGMGRPRGGSSVVPGGRPSLLGCTP